MECPRMPIFKRESRFEVLVGSSTLDLIYGRR